MEKPYFTANVSKSGKVLMVNVPSKRRKEFPKDSTVKVELIKRGDEEELTNHKVLGERKKR
tara:strand:+ start:852 stop:1034 length:183 start_codon:yes stop_codon:yes gene_type:complete